MTRPMGGEDETILPGASILLVEDEPAVASVVRQALETRDYSVTAVDCVKDALEALDGRPFDGAVIDVGLPDGLGFDVLDSLRRRERPCGAVIMTGDPNDETVARSIHAGVTEFLPKPFRSEQLLSAVARAVEHTHDFRARMALATGDDGKHTSSIRALPADELERIASQMTNSFGLTEREHEILALILGGLQNADIATALNISGNTVKYHVRNVLSKLGYESRTELFRTLLQRS